MPDLDPQPLPREAVTRSKLAADLVRLGVRHGAVVMVHTRMSALGWVVGGSETVVRALLDALGPDGTLMAYAGWQEHVFGPADWPEEHRAAYVAEPPVFHPATAEAARDYGRIPERIRTWPGAARSVHPEASVVAVGRRAGWLTADHPPDDAYGADTPFAKLVAAGGQVLMLGAPLETVTLLHHAEALAHAPGKRRITSQVWVAGPQGDELQTFDDIDTSDGAYPFEALDLGGVDGFEVIAREALAAGIGVRGRVGQADCHLFEAQGLTDFAVRWIEERFGG
jgi:aminoglycoside 3-N-acetyltransferase